MKKLSAVIIAFLPLLLCSCSAVRQVQTSAVMKGIWITAAETAPESSSLSDYIFKSESMMQNLQLRGFTDVFVQVRPYCDAVYHSAIFPKSKYISSVDFDPFAVICKSAHACTLKVHAWINPYRVSTDTNDVLKLPDGSPARELYEKDKNSLMILEDGIYLNPASIDAQKLILNGVREILDGYPVDGIHADDYFYPADVENADLPLYKKYIAAGGSLCLSDYRRANVSSLISSVYSAVKSRSGDLVFSVSPCADTEKCYSISYADVKKWCESDGYCDFIIPQIYFGFNNSFIPFESCLDKWRKMCPENRLCIGLALYKQGKEDVYAGEGRNEWVENSDVIKKQLCLCEEYGLGCCLFSYGFLSENF